MRRFLLGSLLGSLLLTGCAARGPHRWPAGEPGTQALFRVEATTNEGDKISFRLVLRWESEERFQLAAADQAGRTHWSLTVEGGRVTFADHQNRLVCRAAASRRLRLPMLGLDLPPLATVRVLLGELPVPLPATATRDENGVRFRDERGQLWTVAQGADHRPRGWQLERSRGKIVASWQRGEVRDELRLPEAGLTLRWRLASTEQLPAGWRPAPAPDGFREGECGLDRAP